MATPLTRDQELTREEVQRYGRHITLPEIGIEGQQRLKRARVLCIGAGGLGSPAALYLAAAGVGTLGLVDFDLVDVSNLQRQILHGTPDVGRPKLDSARDRLHAINPNVALELHDRPFRAANALELVRAYDVVLDGTDNFPTRYLVNDACVLAHRPNAYGSIFRFEGQAAVFAMPDPSTALRAGDSGARGAGPSSARTAGPCYRCLHPEPPPAGLIPSCAEGGVLGVLPGIIGTIQATEAIKLILGIGEPLVGRFLIYDALRMKFRELRLPKDPECPVCGARPTITSLVEYEDTCRAPQFAPEASDITVAELKARMDAGAAPIVIDVREPNEFSICRIPGARLIPLGQLDGRLRELDPGSELIVHCKSGARSARAVSLLKSRGFDRARNLNGGILAWIDEVDSTLPKY